MTRSRFLLFFVLVFVLRVSIAARFRGNFDTQSFLIAVQAVVSGENVYAATERYNYSPVWAHVVTGVWKVATPNVGLFVFLLGFLQIAADAASTGLLVGIGRRRLGLPEAESRRRAMLFFSNPVSVLISCAHGQFDGLSIVFLLGALLAAGATPSRGRDAKTSALLAASLLVKHVTLFHPLLFARRLRRGGLADWAVAAPYAVFAASFLPYAAAFGSLAQNLVVYGARLSQTYLQKPGGLSALFGFPDAPRAIPAALLLAAVALAILRTRHLDLSRASLVLFLTLLVFSPSYAVQYLVWPIALGSLYPSAGYGLFTLFAALYHSAAPESVAIPWPVSLTELGTWSFAALWLGLEILSARKARLGPSPDLASTG